jgi:transcriptional regulator with XRE-family HTH domain
VKNQQVKRVPLEAKIIGKNLRFLREKAGLTQKELAFILEITFQQVQKYERGENRFPVEKLHALKKHFGVPYHAFFRGLEEEEPERPWPEALCAKLVKVRDIALQDRIARVSEIMME